MQQSFVFLQKVAVNGARQCESLFFLRGPVPRPLFCELVLASPYATPDYFREIQQFMQKHTVRVVIYTRSEGEGEPITRTQGGEVATYTRGPETQPKTKRPDVHTKLPPSFWKRGDFTVSEGEVVEF